MMFEREPFVRANMVNAVCLWRIFSYELYTKIANLHDPSG